MQLSIKLASALALLGKVCILSAEESGAHVQQNCVQELVQGLSLEVGWSHPVHLPGQVFTLCSKAALQEQVCCVVQCPHILFHIWKWIIWH